MERVYLSDWLYNAGIVGFLRIMLGNEDIEQQDMIRIGENYIEFDREILDGFSKKYFDFAFRRYGRYERMLNYFSSLLEDLNNLKAGDMEDLKIKYGKEATDIPSTILEDISRRLNSFTRLKSKVEIPSKRDIKNKPEILIEFLELLLDVMRNDFEDFWESDVQIYLRNFYGQKSFLNNSVTQNRFRKFYGDFEEKILKDEIKYDKHYRCIICGERMAKKDTMFDTGISPFYGLNFDSLNFSWNFTPILPVCEICEVIYLCYFAGLTPLPQSNKIHYFVNRDISVLDIYKANNLLEQILNSNRNESFLIEFFTQLVLESEKIKAKYALQNIAVIELNLESNILPKIYSFNISKEKAEYIRDNYDGLRRLSRNFYTIKDETRYLLLEVVEMILTNRLSYEYLNRLLKIYITSEKPGLYHIGFNVYILQEINKLIYRFYKKIFSGREIMEEKEIWHVYFKGRELSQQLRNADAENKISSIAYKLLNALKIGNINQFMDTIMRIYLAYELEIPSTFVKAMEDKEIFYPVGYSFLNGLLERKKEENQNG